MSADQKDQDESRAKSPARLWPQRVLAMIDAKRLREQTSNKQSVAAIWNKAVESARDAEIAELSMDGALQAAYNAGHLAALALLAAHGLRPGSGQGHHEAAFAGAAAIGGAGLEDLVADSEEIRGLRKGSLYDPVIAGPEDRELALNWMRRTLPPIRRALVASDPSISALVTPYRPGA